MPFLTSTFPESMLFPPEGSVRLVPPGVVERVVAAARLGGIVESAVLLAGRFHAHAVHDGTGKERAFQLHFAITDNGGLCIDLLHNLTFFIGSDISGRPSTQRPA